MKTVSGMNLGGSRRGRPLGSEGRAGPLGPPVEVAADSGRRRATSPADCRRPEVGGPSGPALPQYPGSEMKPVETMRVAIDIGGTFTDLCLVTSGGEFFSHKLLTTPDDPAIAFRQILREALAARGGSGREVTEVLHATTIATNAILEGKTARLGLITTRGFRDVLEIGRHFRRNLYSFFLEKPPPLVPRELRLEANERIDARGKVLRPLAKREVVRAGRDLAKAGVEVIVVCFINSYVNPRHERLAARWLTAALGLPVLASHQLCWECREFERFSTAAINGAVLPRVVNYVRGLRAGLRADGIAARLGIMQSNGGLAGVDAVCRNPARIVESGPAAGVIAAAAVGGRLGVGNLVAFDMGGTTAKAGLIEDGRVAIRSDFEVGGGLQGGFGTGYPLRLPAVDLVEVGTGGGSICRLLDGRFTVGPDSAGALPGPACYGRGGSEATITDAHAALGRLIPEFFAGGRFRLDTGAARESIRRRLGGGLGMSIEKAASGVLALADLQMVQALRLVTVQRGLDPRSFVLVTFGGAGPMHAASLLRELGAKLAVIPPEAGVQSAWGLLVADMRRDYQQAFFSAVSGESLPRLAGIFSDLRRRARNELGRGWVSEERIGLRFALDMRYRGQAYEITVECPESEKPDRTFLAAMADRFHTQHKKLYGFAEEARPAEFTVVRLAALVGRVREEAPRRRRSGRPLRERQLRNIPAFFDRRYHRTAVYRREDLGAQDLINGPAIIAQAETTTVVPPWAAVTVNQTGDLLLELR